MLPYNYSPHKKRGKFKVGDRVRTIYSGFRELIGEVIEDRGNIGVKGMRLYTVQIKKVDEWNDHTSEYPEDSLELVEAVKSRNG